jgi:hypothetical protein
MEELEIIIHQDGSISMRTLGMKGETCEKIKDWVVEQGLGEIVRAEHTHEYYEISQLEQAKQKNYF